MIRIGIIGSENSHAAAFTRLFNETDAYPGLRVVALHGEDEASNRAQCEQFHVTHLTPEAMLGRVDAVMVTSRRGDLHLPYVRPFLEAGIPAFIDKPATMGDEDAAILCEILTRTKTPFCGGSSIRLVPDALALRDAAAAAPVYSGHVWAPVSMHNLYGNFFFYASHLTETALTIFGYKPYAVSALRTERGVQATLDYREYAVALSFQEGLYRYGATVITSAATTTRELNVDDCYAHECAHFARMLETRESPLTPQSLLAPVYVMSAIERALTSGRNERIVMS